MTTEPPPPQPCENCGKPVATQVGDIFICDDCYSASGSCCSGE